jgi:hypothetical protein
MYSGDINPSEIISSQIALLKKRKLDIFLDEKTDQFRKMLDRLQQLIVLPSNEENFKEARNAFKIIFDAVPLLTHRLSDVEIFRAQMNRPNELFTTQGRISYNKERPDLITSGKFNSELEPMFYGSLPYRPDKEEKYVPPAMVACLETCKSLSDPQVTV